MNAKDFAPVREALEPMIRDQFRAYAASQALAAIIRNDRRTTGGTSHERCQEQTELAVDYADWLLVALERK